MSVLNVIRCDLLQNDYLVWKWQAEQGTPSRQNQIRLGSSLRVRAGEVAVFFYSTGGGDSALDYIEGPADLRLETKNLPVLANIIGLAYGGDTPFQAEVYFINKGQAPQLKWGVPYFDAFDLRFPDLPVPVAANGTVTFSIVDAKRFVEVQRLENVDPDKLREQILPQLRTVIKSNIVNLATARGIPLVQIGSRLDDLSMILQPTASKVLEGYGVALRNFVVEGVEFKTESDGYKFLMRITRDQAVHNIEKQGDMERKNMEASQAINAQHIANSLKIQREQQELRQTLTTESDFLPTHQVNLQAGVAKAAAESLGKIGSRGGGDGGGGGVLGGIGAAAITIGMGLPVGAALGQQIVSGIAKIGGPVLGGTAGTCPRCNAPFQSGAKFCSGCGASVTPAPGPAPNLQNIYIARGKHQLGIFTLDEVNRKIGLGEFIGSDLGWYPSLAGWQPLSAIPGVSIPPQTPPPL